jgi:hypothetical protein
MKQESKVLWLEFEKNFFPVFGVNYDKGLHFKGKVLIVGSVYDKLLSRYCYDILAEFYPNSTLILVRDGHSQRKLWRFLFHYELIGSFINQDTQKKIAVFETLQRKKLLYDNRDTSL